MKQARSQMNTNARRYIMRLFFVILASLGLVQASLAATHYVVPPETPGATPADPYTNWVTAGTNIIEVVNAAMTNTAPRIVWITNGTYYLTNVISFTNAITVQGVNGWTNTIINGNGPALTNIAFYINCSAGQTGIVDGLAITNCNDSGIVIANRGIVQNCLITGCRRVGGGAGGGLSLGSAATIINCMVRGNTANVRGAGIFMQAADSIVIRDTRIEDNRLLGSEGGAGVYADNVWSITITNCVIVNNLAATKGGGVQFTTIKSLCSLVNSEIISNTAAYNNDSLGGGIYCNVGANAGPFLVQNCKIQGNGGGAVPVRHGGGIYALGDKITIRNCLITDNMVKTNGAGIWCQTGIVENCTIVSNRSTGVGAGGGIYMDAAGGSVTALNNIVYYNTASNAANFTNAQGNVNLSYSCVIPAVDGAGNITNEPIFIDLSGGNFNLHTTDSPCINAGFNQTWMTNAFDLDGNPRIRNKIVDLGAYEQILNGTICYFY